MILLMLFIISNFARKNLATTHFAVRLKKELI